MSEPKRVSVKRRLAEVSRIIEQYSATTSASMVEAYFGDEVRRFEIEVRAAATALGMHQRDDARVAASPWGTLMKSGCDFDESTADEILPYTKTKLAKWCKCWCGKCSTKEQVAALHRALLAGNVRAARGIVKTMTAQHRAEYEAFARRATTPSPAPKETHE